MKQQITQPVEAQTSRGPVTACCAPRLHILIAGSRLLSYRFTADPEPRACCHDFHRAWAALHRSA